MLRRVILYVGIMAFIALFGIVYEQFSHGVNSNYMWFAWVWVSFGLIPYLFFYLVPIKYAPGTLTESVYNLGVAMVTVRSIFIGVMAIYGKTNIRLEVTYTVLSILFLSLGFLMYVIPLLYKYFFNRH